jgi:hypothetical protein
MDQAPAVIPGKIIISGDPQKRDAHVERIPHGYRSKSGLPVGEMAGVFPKKVSDKRLH